MLPLAGFYNKFIAILCINDGKKIKPYAPSKKQNVLQNVANY